MRLTHHLQSHNTIQRLLAGFIHDPHATAAHFTDQFEILKCWCVGCRWCVWYIPAGGFQDCFLRHVRELRDGPELAKLIGEMRVLCGRGLNIRHTAAAGLIRRPITAAD